jgi:hypothetical protein
MDYTNNHAQGYPDEPYNGRTSGGSTVVVSAEKETRAPNRSKRFIWRMTRLGASLALTIAVLVLTLIILVAGRHGDGSSDLSLITVDMTNFARFNPPQITLVTKDEATKTKRGLGDFVSDVAGKASDAAGSVESLASGAASKVESAAGAVATAAEQKADEIIGEIGDKLDDLENAVMGLMEKVLGTIQDALNRWLQEVAGALDDLDIPRTMSLHLTTYCSSGNATLAPANSTANSTTNSTRPDSSASMSCTKLFSSGHSSFNETANNGTIFGFQPGAVLAKALGVFYVPQGAQLAIREPVDNGVNTVDRLVHKAGAELSAWSVNLLFIPIVAMYAIATFFTCLLLILLLIVTVATLKDHEAVDGRIFGLAGIIAAAAAFFLLLGSVILTVIGLVAYVVSLGAGVVDITVASSSKLKWMSWAAFIVMALLAISLKVQEFVADCKTYIKLLMRLFGGSKPKAVDSEKSGGRGYRY